MSRLSHAQLLRLAEDMSPRRRDILETVWRLRMVAGGQLRRLYFPQPGQSPARLARLDLAALHELDVLHRLQRRVGGVRAGSAGYVYTVGPVGRRLVEFHLGQGLDGGRSRYEPTEGFVQHSLAVTEVWVALQEYLRMPIGHDRDTTAEYRVERHAWRNYVGAHGSPATLKPDAELIINRHGFQDIWWLEIDRSTVHPAKLRQKLHVYLDYYATGREQEQRDVFPLTAWLTVSKARAEVIQRLIDGLPPIGQRLFRVGLIDSAPPLLMSQTEEPS